MGSVLYTLAAILMFGIMITVHEAGHFFAARMSGIPVKEFAIGFGPKLLSWKRRKHDTQFSLRAIPMGGYCAFYGEDDGSEEAKKDPASFNNFGIGKRLITLLAGSLMNIVLAFVVAVLFYVISGIPQITGVPTTSVQAINESSPAQLAGMQPLDVIRTINGQPVTDNVSELIDAATKEGAGALTFVVDRPGTGEMTLLVTPMFSAEANRYMIGVSLETRTPQEWRKGSLSETLAAAWEMCVGAGRSIIDSLNRLIFRGEGVNEVTGFVGITQTIVQTTRTAQLQGYLFLMCLISINLGIFNLLPIPGLDGSRVLFLLVEAVRGKPFKREGYVHAIGMLLLLGLMLWINLRDIARLL